LTMHSSVCTVARPYAARSSRPRGYLFCTASKRQSCGHYINYSKTTKTTYCFIIRWNSMLFWLF